MMAKAAATKAIEKSIDDVNNPFRFFNLPNELQRHILSFTDVIAPDRIHRVENKFISNGKTSCYLEYEDRDSCCFSQYAAWSAPLCQCWEMPLSIFASCKSIRAMAVPMFATRNVFYAHEVVPTPVAMDWSWTDKNSTAFDYFRHFPTIVLSHLSRLTIYLRIQAYRPVRHFQPTTDALNGWNDLVRLISRGYFHPHLKLILAVFYFNETFGTGNSTSLDTDGGLGVRILADVRTAIARPFPLFNCLGGFIVFLSLSIDQFGPDDWETKRWDGRFDTKQWEVATEKVVMGPGYDSSRAGKVGERGLIAWWYM